MTGFWEGRRVFLTGHTGFKGGWLALWLKSLGAHVAGYALPPDTCPNLFEAARIATAIDDSRLGDIRDRNALVEALTEFAPDTVFHLAAQPLVRLSYEDPAATFATNVLGTAHLLDGVRACPSVRSVVIVTSDKCYENNEWVWAYRENDAMGGHDPYSASKGCTELVTRAYRASYFSETAVGRHAAKIASVRAGNVIGGGDWSRDRLIPDIVRALGRGEAVPIRFPNAMRPWQHVLEPLSGYLAVAERLSQDGDPFADGWNFGPLPSSEQPVSIVVDRICRLWGNGASWEHVGGQHVHEANYLRLDSGKARLRLGWEPTWSLDQALDATVDWYRRHAQDEDMQSVCIEQISAYQAAQCAMANS